MSRARIGWRGLAVALGSALGFGSATAALVAALESAGVEQPPSSLDVTAIVEDRLAQLAREDPSHEQARVFLLGDSTSVPLPERLAGELAAVAQAGRPARITSLVIMGQTTFDEYFLSEAIARAEPDAVVIALHLAGFSDSWRTGFAKPEFAGWLPLRRVVEAVRLPLHAVGLTTDELLWYMTIVGAGQADAWRALVRWQVRVGRAARDAEAWLAARLGSADRHRELLALTTLERRISPGLRLTPAGARIDYDAVLNGLQAGHPGLEVLRALLASLRARGIPTLVAVMPVNVEHLDRLGLLGGSALPASLATLEALARAQGAGYLDLHDALPDAAFADASGHFGGVRDFDGPGLVVRRLAPAVTALLAREPD